MTTQATHQPAETVPGTMVNAVPSPGGPASVAALVASRVTVEADAEADPFGLFVVCPDVAAVAVADPFVLAGLLAPLSMEEIGVLTQGEAEVMVAATQRVINALAARQAAAVDAFHGEVLQTLADEQAAAEEEAAARGLRCVVDALDPTRVTASMLAPILHLAPRTMVTRTFRAVQLMNFLPTTSSRAWVGDLEPGRVEAIVAASLPVRPGKLVEFDARVHHTDLIDLPVAAVRKRAEKAALRADPDGVQERHSQGHRRRAVNLYPGDAPGMSRWIADLPADTSARMWAAVDALATEFLTADTAAGQHRSRTVSNARADALGALVLANAKVETHLTLILPAAPAQNEAAAPAPGEAADEPRVQVTFDVQPVQLAWLNDEDPPRPGPQRPAPPPLVPPPARVEPTPTSPVVKRAPLVAGTMLHDLVHGIVTAETADASPMEWELAGQLQPLLEVSENPHLTLGVDGRAWFVPGPVTDPKAGVLLPAMIQRLLADPDIHLRITSADPNTTDQVGQGGSGKYRPGKHLARAVRARDQHCRFPGCTVPATQCDLDHAVPYPEGPTTAANLHALCRFHHLFKHHAHWTLRLDPDGTCTWTTPTGRQHITTPPDLHDLAA